MISGRVLTVAVDRIRVCRVLPEQEGEEGPTLSTLISSACVPPPRAEGN